MSDDLDSILDAALDEFDAHASASAVAATPTPPPAAAAAAPAVAALVSPPSSSPIPTPAEAEAAAAAISDPASMAAFQAFLQAMSNPALGGADPAAAGAAGGAPDIRELEAMIAQMAKAELAGSASAAAAASAASPSAGVAVPASSSSSSPAVAAASSAPASSDPVSDAIRMIAEGARSMPPAGAGGAAGSGMGFDLNDPNMEAMLTKLMADMAGGGGAGGAGGAGGLEDMDGLVERMMGGMLSREYLYQPMKDIADKYPTYIREHAAELSESDLSNYRKQQSCFERIVAAFDSPAALAGKSPSAQVMELMNEMQQYGTPPKELVSDFMPPGFDPQAPMPPGMGQLAGLPGMGMGAGAVAGGMPPMPPGMDEAFMQQLAKDDCKTQ